MSEKFSNFGATTIASATVAAAATSFDVTSVANLPSISSGDFYRATIIRASDGAHEIVYVTAASSTTLTVTRAQEGTSALDLVSGDTFIHRVTAGMLNALSSRDTVTISSPSGTSTSKSVTIQVSRAGYFMLRLQLCDGATPLGQPTLNPPTGSSNVDFERVTNSAGALTLTFSNDAVSAGYYLHVILAGAITVSDVITIGT